jgi:sugar-specific transcriptional regulator TrmB
VITDTIRMHLKDTLKEFGLDDKRAKVYLAILELGTAKAYDIAHKSKISRPTVYDILEKLASDGLVGIYEKRGIRYYIANDPEKIKRKLQEKERAFDAVLPELRSVYNALITKPKMSYFEGIEGIKTVLEDTITGQEKLLYGILSMDDLFKTAGKQFMDAQVKKRVATGYQLKVIRSKPKDILETWPTSAQELRELRYSPAGMVFAMTTYIYDNKVALISSKKENFGMIIESNEFHQNMRHLFGALWQISTPA